MKLAIQSEVEGAMLQRELESLRAWKETILGAPNVMEPEWIERFRESSKMKLFIDEWRRKVLTLEAENAELKRDAACFEALYEMAKITQHFLSDISSVYCINVMDPTGENIKDRERFRKAIEAGTPA